MHFRSCSVFFFLDIISEGTSDICEVGDNFQAK